MQVKTHPPHDIIGQDIRNFLPGKAPAAEMLLMLMEKSKTIFAQHSVNQVRADLKEHPATMIWLWGQGGAPRFTAF